MKILVFGDVFGRIGRNALIKEIPLLKERYHPDFIVANVENMSSGRGPIESHMNVIHSLDIDVCTSGDHIFDNDKNLMGYMKREDCKLIRPANYFESPYYEIFGDGYKVIEKNEKKLLVINLISGTFTRDSVYNPFLKADEIIRSFEEKGEKLHGIIIDFHKEVASEGYGLAYFLDGRASFIFGTHTHIQTNDDTIFKYGIGLLSDVGMVGPKNSVIGSDFASLKKRFLTGINKGKIEQAITNEYVIHGACVEIDEETMKCVSIEKIRKFGTLLL